MATRDSSGKRDDDIATYSLVHLAPTYLAYTSYLLRVAYSASFEELLGAVPPYYWICWEVGKALESQGSPNKLYQRWIDTYAAEEFGAPVRQVLDVLNVLAAGLPEGRREVICRHFVMTSRYEWMFRDAAWRLESWPVGEERESVPLFPASGKGQGRGL